MNFRDPAMSNTPPFDYTPGNVERYDAAGAAACSCNGSPSTPQIDTADMPDPGQARARWIADQATLCARTARQELADQNENYEQYRARLTGNAGPSAAQAGAAAAAAGAKENFAVARTNASIADPDAARKAWIERTRLEGIQGAQHVDKI